MHEPAGFSIGKLTGFIDHLRQQDFPVTTGDVVQCAETLAGLDEPDLLLSRRVMRVLLCRSQEAWRIFDQVFQAYWSPQQEIGAERRDVVEQHDRTARVAGISGTTGQESELYDSIQGAFGGAGRQNALVRADYRFLNDRTAMKRVEMMAERLAERLRIRTRRRYRLSRKGKRLVIGKSLSESIHTAGVPLRPWYSSRLPEPPKLLVLHDVSHSMTFNNPLLVRFTRGLIRRFRDSHAFVFHTRLFQVTEIFRQRTLERMKAELEHNDGLWLGGTCIADSLSEFRKQYGKRILTTSTRVVIISDGLDSNDSQRLARELIILRRQSRMILWLNPMLGREGFDAQKQEVLSIRRHVDRLLPAHNLESLQNGIRALC